MLAPPADICLRLYDLGAARTLLGVATNYFFQLEPQSKGRSANDKQCEEHPPEEKSNPHSDSDVRKGQLSTIGHSVS